MVNIFGKRKTRPRYLSFQRSNISSKPGHKVRTGSHVDERHDELRDLVLCQGRSNPNFNLLPGLEGAAQLIPVLRRDPFPALSVSSWSNRLFKTNDKINHTLLPSEIYESQQEVMLQIWSLRWCRFLHTSRCSSYIP
ncbi:uncharacterized protein LOC120425972 [Culex pipiens pallens]|uniref:uncharacterized protein LOC120425972 n=1 Tax=Culex pipiens pallens TaxID=42434 RepID=UPI001952D7FF|nr:uncharacterized protein LOC120425972 [Culex pipiens pallens]